MGLYNLGDLVRVSGAFTTAAGSATDPGTVTTYYRNPAGSVTTLVYGADAALVKDSTGNYHVDIDANLPGYWHYAFRGTGSGQSAGENHFQVAPSTFY